FSARGGEGARGKIRRAAQSGADMETAEHRRGERRAGRETAQADRGAQRARRRAERLRQFRGFGRARAEGGCGGLVGSGRGDTLIAGTGPRTRAGAARSARSSRAARCKSERGERRNRPRLLPPAELSTE